MSIRPSLGVVLLCIGIGIVSCLPAPVQASESFTCCNHGTDCWGSLMCCNPAGLGLPPCSCGDEALVGYCRSSCTDMGTEP